MRNFKLACIVTIMLPSLAFSQEQTEIKEFKPSGKPYAKVYSNFNVNNYDGKTDYAFDLTRAYLGYGYKFSENFSGKLNIDVGAPEVNIGDSLKGSTNLDLTAYLKNASLTYKYDKLTVDFGLISTKQFKTQEGIWGHRYLFKSFMDENKFGSSADLGVSVSYKFIDMLSADITIMNGEGYKTLQADSIFKYGVGVTGKPINGLVVRVYYDMMGNDNLQSTIATFVGYETEKIEAGVEYNMQSNNKMKDGYDFSGFSVYGSYQATNKIQGFARFDNLSSVKLNGASDAWNIKKDGQTIIAGVELSPVKGVKIAPNYQGWLPAKSGSKSVSSFFVNIELKF